MPEHEWYGIVGWPRPSGLYFWSDRVVVCHRHCRNIRLQPVSTYDIEKGYGTGVCPFCKGGLLYGRYHEFRSKRALEWALEWCDDELAQQEVR